MRHALLKSLTLQEKCENYISRYGHELSVNGYTVKTVAEARDRVELLRLRSQVYDKELGWVSSQDDGLEVDQFDIYSSHFAVTSPSGKMVGTMRSTESEHPWMAVECYNKLFEQEALKMKATTSVELSRLCINQKFRDVMVCNGTSIFELIMIWTYIQSLSQGIEKSYFITHSYIGMVLKRCGFFVSDISDQIGMEDGCVIQSFEMDHSSSLKAAIDSRPFLQSLF